MKMLLRTNYRPFGAIACGAALLLTSPAAVAAVLTGSGPHLPIPGPNPPWPPGISESRVVIGGGFQGSWAVPANANWVGTYNAVGPIPSAFNTGAIRYDFTSLPLGYLPAGTFFIFGDVDGGSGNPERFHIEAFDSGGNTITTEWLDDTVSVTGAGTGGGGSIVSNNMPGWDWNLTQPNEYLITGGTVTGGNPSVALALVTNQNIYRMRLEKPTTHYGFAMMAPTIPEPTSLALLAGGLVVLGGAARRRVG